MKQISDIVKYKKEIKIILDITKKDICYQLKYKLPFM